MYLGALSIVGSLKSGSHATSHAYKDIRSCSATVSSTFGHLAGIGAGPHSRVPPLARRHPYTALLRDGSRERCHGSVGLTRDQPGDTWTPAAPPVQEIERFSRALSSSGHCG